jgi:hypothetical protein
MMDYSRRHFIKKSFTGVAGLSLVSTIPGSWQKLSAKPIPFNETLHVGLIGGRIQGFRNLKAHLSQSNVRCVAMCDADSNILDDSFLCFIDRPQ